MNHLVSIVIPTYNREDYILEAVNSCLSQDYLEIEVIVVDDGSTDNTSSLVSSISDSRFKYYLVPNNGACYARNYGLSKCSGFFVKFLDSDDRLFSNAVSSQVDLYLKLKSKCSLPIICGYHQIIDSQGELLFTKRRFKASSSDFYTYSISDILTNNPPTTIPLYPISVFDNNDAFDIDLDVLQDFDLPYRLLLNSCSFIYANICIYQMRRHVDPKSVHLINSRVKALHHYDILLKHWKLLSEYFKLNGFSLSILASFGVRYYLINRKIRKSRFIVASPFPLRLRLVFLLSPRAFYCFLLSIFNK